MCSRETGPERFDGSVYKFLVVGLLSCETKILSVVRAVICRHTQPQQQINALFQSRSH